MVSKINHSNPSQGKRARFRVGIGPSLNKSSPSSVILGLGPFRVSLKIPTSLIGKAPPLQIYLTGWGAVPFSF